MDKTDIFFLRKKCMVNNNNNAKYFNLNDRENANWNSERQPLLPHLFEKVKF